MQLTVTKENGEYIIEVERDVRRLIRVKNREEAEQIIQAYL